MYHSFNHTFGRFCEGTGVVPRLYVMNIFGQFILRKDLVLNGYWWVHIIVFRDFSYFLDKNLDGKGWLCGIKLVVLEKSLIPELRPFCIRFRFYIINLSKEISSALYWGIFGHFYCKVSKVKNFWFWPCPCW